MKLAYSPWGNGDSVHPFSSLFSEWVNAKEKGFDDVDAFLLWGGTDIHPSFYKQTHNRFNGAPTLPSERDVWEWKAMKYCLTKGIPIIGVCRGAQFLCAFAGGSLFQHVGGHGNGQHDVITNDGRRMEVTSSHHQMMNIKKTQHELIAWTPHALSRIYFEESCETGDETWKDIIDGSLREPEIVYFPSVRGLAIQGHPEWVDATDPFAKYSNELVEEYLLTKELV